MSSRKNKILIYAGKKDIAQDLILNIKKDKLLNSTFIESFSELIEKLKSSAYDIILIFGIISKEKIEILLSKSTDKQNSIVPILFISSLSPKELFGNNKIPVWIDHCPWPSSTDVIQFRISSLLKLRSFPGTSFQAPESVDTPDLKQDSQENKENTIELKKKLDQRTNQLAKELTENVNLRLKTVVQKSHSKNSDQFVTTLINTIPIPIYYKDEKGIYIECNDSFAAFLGLNRNEILGYTVFDFFEHKQAQKIYDEDVKLIKGSGIFKAEQELIHHDGTFRNVLIIKKKIILDNNEAGLIGVLYDTTEAKANEKYLRTQYTIDYLSSLKKGLKKTLKQILDLMFEYKWVDIGGIYLFNDDKSELILEYHMGLPEEIPNEVRRYSIDSEQFKFLKKKKSYYGNYNTVFQNDLEDQLNETYRAMAIIPLIDRQAGELIGSLNLASLNYASISSEDKQNFEAIATRIVYLIKYAQAQDELKRTNTELESIVDQRTKELRDVNDLLEKEVLLQHETKKALNLSEKLYHGIFDNSQDGIVLYNAETFEIIDINKCAHDDLGYTRQEFLKLKSDDFTIYNSKDDRIRILQELRENGNVSYQVKHKKKNGEILFRTINANIMLINQKKYILGNVHDITNIIKKNEEIRESEEKFRDLQDNIPIGIFTTSMEGSFEYGNKALLGMLGYDSLEEIKKHKLWEHNVVPDDHIKIETNIKEKGLISNYEMQIKTKNGKIFWVLISMNVISGIGTANSICDGVIKDISDRKKSEFKLEQAKQRILDINKSLEAKIRAALKAQTRQQNMLIQKSKIESLGELAAGIAHEINQPLGIISMSFENLQSRINSKQSSPEYLDTKFKSIEQNITRIRSIIDHIRIFSREQEMPTLDKVKLNKIVNQALSLIGAQYRNNNIHLKTDLQENIGFTVGSSMKLEQAILNLLSNAKYAVEDKGTYLNEDEYSKEIIITTQRKGKKISLLIGDNGVGIDSKNRDRIFDPFFTTKPEGQGTGLGLSIVYGIIKDMRGEIKVNTKKGQFTNFEILFPRLPEND